MSGLDYPPGWRLWHPNQGVHFAPKQAPLYPVLDVARFFSGAASTAELAEDSAKFVAEASLVKKKKSYVRRVASSSGKVLEEAIIKECATISEARSEPRKTSERTGAAASEEGPNDASKAPEVPNQAASEEETKKENEENVATEPPYNDLEFKLPKDLFEKARAAKPGTPESFWSHALYRGPSEDSETPRKVTVHYCKSKLTTERVCQYFLNEKVIGLDLEWSPDARTFHDARKNVSLVQLASPSRIALFHLALFPAKDELATPTLKKIIEDLEIMKCGVWIKGDCTKLRKYLGIQAQGIFELSHLYKQVKYSESGQHDLIDKRLVPLATQVKEVLHLPMYKGQDVRASDWSHPLAMDQINYSASDAYAAVHLFACLNHQRQNLDPSPPLPFYAELGLPIPLADGALISTSDEAESEAEAVEEDSGAQDQTNDTALSHEYLRVVEGLIAVVESSLHLQGDSDSVEPAASEPAASEPPKSKSKSKSKSKKKALEKPPKDPRVVEAENWLSQCDRKRAAAAAMRAYYIWHADDDMTPEAVAAVVRDPPLKMSTITSYICEAIKFEGLPYDPVRLRTEVLDAMPRDLLEMRFRALDKATKDVAVPTPDDDYDA